MTKNILSQIYKNVIYKPYTNLGLQVSFPAASQEHTSVQPFSKVSPLL